MKGKMAQRRPLLIRNATLVLKDAYLSDGALLARDGVIQAVGTMDSIGVPEDAEVWDAGGRYLGPGLIDIHIHAGGGRFFYQDPAFAAAHVLRHGVTSVLPTLYYDLTLEGYLAAIDRINAAMDDGSAPNIRGYYMEGPYTNPRYGACAQDNRWAAQIRRSEYMPLLEKVGTRARVWVIAPEREGIDGFVDDAKKASPEAIFSVGHSEADAETVERMMQRGLRLATHHTNAVGNPPKYGGCHRPGIEDAVYANDEIYAELIVDSMGIHVAPYMLRLIAQRLKRRDRIILISDATAFSGSGSLEGMGADLSFDDQGALAGSRLTLDTACGNMIRHTACSVADAFRYASENPARLLGWSDRGEIAIGKTADLVCVDDRFRVQGVFLGGKEVQIDRRHEEE